MPLRRTTAPPRDAGVDHPLFSRFYVRFAGRLDTRAGVAAHRRELLDGLSGRVVEIGAGNGLNFAHYPRAVSEVVAIEPERTLRAAALEAARRAGVPVDVVPGTAEALPVKSEAFDAAVVSLVLCSVRDVPRALAELRRVLRPGGELRFFEHGRAGTAGRLRVQRALDATVWPRLFGNCHTARDPLAELSAAGFELGAYRRLTVPDGGPTLPTSPCVLGVARRPFPPPEDPPEDRPEGAPPGGSVPQP
ncbi:MULTISPECIES: class I SAM-dependent methyltransferase [Streptomyces]|uniref:Class I SAM-dependent methyltransferase n=1 Tax=Streptomyces tsukubensis (strain DSM 42081 / NBRC 108919 / NRRL 18488 / 9993) TaxID=1114943 RepID=I2MUQ5_STRT9|nr:MULTISPECIES: class I SAM-dependent methyltransferase [Streptomyces]AZK93006.1 SAM-dependent methyltransferase [Streptomyces tsukubensis]EIF88502.1 Methyltransferase type 11 [Streptomyces tsukubensis NRRL18488]MYS67089.1 methyltransferase domain-containing protein [Streptomyces sp. SID5473]QKM70830.1 class I SAM-dependent methyltransferase [Streptomyces tsukubensis NRRL18488]TAI41052.1 class I SAM-dependent methyltransferase [Streptomyces tsukubensis]